MTEPIFRAVRNDDPRVAEANRQAASSISEFQALMRQYPEAFSLAKLRFRDPDLSEQRGKDAFFYLWLSEVSFQPSQNLFVGTFFEVPKGFEKYHAVGSRLAFECEDVFDWMVNRDGYAYGAFSIRVHREGMSETEQEEYDGYMGIKSYAQI